MIAFLAFAILLGIMLYAIHLSAYEQIAAVIISVAAMIAVLFGIRLHDDRKRKLMYRQWEQEAIEADEVESEAEENPAFNPREFERQVADVFRAYGYRVFETPRNGDHGIDLKVFKGNEYAVVQCKRYTKPIGEPVLRDFFGAIQHEEADHGFLITTSRFTDSAVKWAKGKRIVLIDGPSFQKMLDETAAVRGVAQ